VPAAKRKFCSRLCYGKYKAVNAVGSGNSNWRGGVQHERDGRIRRFAPEHPAATKQGYVYEYRLVAEEKLGRYLRPDEIVHHVNGDPSDNRSDNLAVMTQAEHARMESRGRQRCVQSGHFLPGKVDQNVNHSIF
jgi:hypothetical protein